MCSVVGSVVFVVLQPGCLQLVVEISGCQLSALAVDAQAVVSLQLPLVSVEPSLASVELSAVFLGLPPASVELSPAFLGLLLA